MTMQTKEKKRFKCSICTQYHDIPDNGFVINDEIYSLLTAETIQMIPTQECDQLELVLNETKLLDYKMKNYKTECFNELNEHCLEQKRLVQLATELKIQNLEENKEHSQTQIDLINQSNEELIEIIDKYEQTCMEYFKNFDAEFNVLVHNVASLHNEIDTYLKENKSNNKKFQKIIQDFEDDKFQINKELKKLKNLIFNKNKIEFIETGETNLGHFEYDKCFKVSII